MTAFLTWLSFLKAGINVRLPAGLFAIIRDNEI